MAWTFNFKHKNSEIENWKMTLVPTDSPTTAAATLAEPSSKQFNLSEQFGSYGKPNAIVRPVRRNESNDEMIQSSLQPPTLSLPPTHMNNANAPNIDSKKLQREDDFSFVKELDFKLKHLQWDKKASSKNVNFNQF